MRSGVASVPLTGSPSSRRAWIEIGKTRPDLSCTTSPSSRRAWIEIFHDALTNGYSQVALLAEGVDRNNVTAHKTKAINLSPSSRRAWIEITSMKCCRATPLVALLAEGVDRNYGAIRVDNKTTVALLAEGVDRNWNMGRNKPGQQVALLAEGVDRNNGSGAGAGRAYKSPSSRRAWIEIGRRFPLQGTCRSPSSRRAWIEIKQLADITQYT